jgi:tetratricopeptide (TPR) repeat protein
MGIFSFFQKKQDSEDIDHISIAEELESKGDFAGAVREYEVLILTRFAEKPQKAYRHVTKKIINCYTKMGDYEKVMELWPTQYDASDYGGKEMHDLIKILEAAQRTDLVMKVYDASGNKLIRNKIEFLIKQKKIPEAYGLITELLSAVGESSPEIMKLWMTKAKLCLSLRKWEEANKYLNKILDKNPHEEEARKLKEFCFKQIRTG